MAERHNENMHDDTCCYGDVVLLKKELSLNILLQTFKRFSLSASAVPVVGVASPPWFCGNAALVWRTSGFGWRCYIYSGLHGSSAINGSSVHVVIVI